MQSKRFVSEKAWKQPSSFENDDFFGHRVVKTDKAVVVMEPFSLLGQRFAKSTTNSLTHVADIVVFPKPVHMPHFVTASKGTVGHGPSADNPSAIGTVQVHLHLAKPHGLRLAFAQAHFKTTDSPEPGKYALPRAMATYYGGWRKRALTEAVKLAIHVGLPLKIHWSNLYLKNRVYSGVSPLHRELLEVANSLGVSVREVRTTPNSRFLIVDPSRVSKELPSSQAMV